MSVITGTSANDTLVGSTGVDTISGLDGDDSLSGGAGNDLLDGGIGNDTLDASQGVDSMIGGLGNDSYIVGLKTPNIIENPGEGHDTILALNNFILSYNASPPDIEDLTFIGTGSFYGSDNSLNNVITGGSGNDFLDSSTGEDTLRGMDGNDTLVSGGFGDFDVLDGGNGFDVVEYRSGLLVVDLSQQKGLGGGAANDQFISIEGVIGWVGSDTLIGSANNDLLDGGSGGNDLLEGDAGSDTISGVSFTASYAHSPSAVNINYLTGAMSGGDAQGDIITEKGASVPNIVGSDFADTFVDSNAKYATFMGGKGDDLYIIQSLSHPIEQPGDGTDTIQMSSATYTLPDNIENLELSAFAASSGTGNASDNYIRVTQFNPFNDSLVGLGGNDTLDGGRGADTMVGGSGDDTYIVDATTDVTTETAGNGTDTIILVNFDSLSTSFAWSLAGTPNIENLTLTGVSCPTGTGNAANNVMTGGIYNNTLFGADGNDTLDGLAGADSLSGDLGNDLYYVDNVGDQVVEALGAGSDTVSASVSFTLSDNVENLVLTGSAVSGTGNGLANVITGDAGANTLDGGLGADTLIGGAGDDTYLLDNAGDTVTEAAGGGTDTVVSTLDYSLGANVENLTLTGSAATGVGNGLDNVITGDGGANSLSGAAGNDTLDGGAGADTLDGGAGNDLFAVDNAGDQVIEGAGGGTDTVTASVDYSLSANVENLTLTGSAASGTGNALDNTLTGNAGANSLDGGDGNDSLIGAGGNDALSGGNGADSLDGGTGADTLTGGAGDDSYRVDNAGDLVVEAPGEGADTVTASVDYALTDNVETLTLTGSAASGTGNALNNLITGTSGANTLDGGAGADTLVGGAGDDSYVVDNVGDAVTETAGGGVDTVLAAVDYSLGANVENLTLTGTAISGTGNSLANVITGDGGDNMLDGGAGADTLIGGTGDDSYVVDNVGDVVTEASGAGVDTVTSSVSYTLSANVETLTLTGSAATGTGNALGNLITGDGVANTLDGGAGADTLIGGAGDDTYVVDDAGDQVVESSGAGVDTVLASVDHTLSANVENLTLTGGANLAGTGNASNNLITGNGGDNSLDGADGADTLAGGAGADQLTGGNGDDSLDGGTGADTLVGGAGDDAYAVDNAGDLVTEAPGDGIDSVTSSVDYALTDNVETLTLTGSAGVGTGNALDNVIIGDAGANTLSGGLGADTVTGGAGDDLFVFGDVSESPAAASDLITDFAPGADRIDLSAIDVDPATLGHQGFTWIGTAAFSAAGQLRYETSGGVTTVEGDIDGDGVADIAIRLTGSLTLSSADMVL